MEVKGDVSYAGVGWKEMKKLYAGWVLLLALAYDLGVMRSG